MTIYELDAAMMACIDTETGEVDAEKWEGLAEEKEHKIENLACYYKTLVAEAEAIKAEEKALAERRKAKENKAESAKAFLKSVLNGEKFETARCSVSYRKTEATEITDYGAAVKWLTSNGHTDCITYRDPEISKTEAKKLLKQGFQIDGIRLVSNTSMGVK